MPGFWPTENLNLPEAYSRRRAFHTSGGNPFLGILGSLVIRFLSRTVERELYRFARMPRRHATPINNNSFQISRACSNYPSKCSISVPNVPNVPNLGNKGRGRARAPVCVSICVSVCYRASCYIPRLYVEIRVSLGFLC